MPANAPTDTVANSARIRFGSSAMTDSDAPAATIARPNRRCRPRRAEREAERGVPRDVAEQPRAHAHADREPGEDRAEQQAVRGVAAVQHADERAAQRDRRAARRERPEHPDDEPADQWRRA